MPPSATYAMPHPMASAQPAAAANVPRRVVVAAVAGNALEFYDFVTYAFFATYIGKAFFPSSSPLTSLLLSVGVFGVGFFARPLGGVLIGAFADRKGRKPAMMLTISLIALGTLGLALTPSYASIGIAAPLLVVAFRLVQGLALGGEVGPATAFLVESAPDDRRGLYGSLQFASQGMATLVAGLFGLALETNLAPDQMQAWGWRVPFAAGLLLVAVALYLRRHMPETLHAGAARATPQKRTELKQHARPIALAALVVLGGSVSTYVGNYMTTYAINTLKLPHDVSMAATVGVGIATLLFSLLGGWLGDRFGRKPAMLWPRVGTLLLTVPAFMLLDANPTPEMLVGVSMFLAALTATSSAASMTAIPELLPRNVRATGMSIAYALGVSLFGGTTQFVVTWLISATGNPAAPAWYVAATSVITLIAILLLPETRKRALEG